MTSKKQIKANRKNAKKSTGAKTLQGKQIVALNSVKHGVNSKALILPDEDINEFKTMVETMKEEFNVSSTIEVVLINKMAEALWRKQRLSRYEQSLIEAENSYLDSRKEYSLFEMQQDIEVKKSILKFFESILKELNKFIIHLNKLIDKKDINDEKPNFHKTITELYDQIVDTLLYHLNQNMRLEDLAILDMSSSSYKENIKRKLNFEINYWTKMMEQELDWNVQFISYLTNQIAKYKNEIRLIEQTNNKFIQLNYLKRRDSHDKIRRYESQLDRQFYKALNELQKLQVFMGAKA